MNHSKYLQALGEVFHLCYHSFVLYLNQSGLEEQLLSARGMIFLAIHYIQDMVQKGVVKLKYVPTEEQVADVLTKPLSSEKFEYFQDKLGVVLRE